MRILIITQYFWPEHFIINDLAEKLSERGHEVVVATGKPNYPSGKIQKGYSKKGVDFETYGKNVKVIRVPIRPRKSANTLNLSLNYLSFATSAIWRLPALLKGEEFDVIFVYCVSPLTAALPAIWLRKQTKGHLVLWIQDLWPESVVATDHVKNPIAISLLNRLAKYIYRKADSILVQSRSFFDPIKSLAPHKNIGYFPNFAPDIRNEAQLPSEISALFADSFNVVFAGNLGRAQSVETILEAAQILKNNFPRAKFFIAGDGSMAEYLKSSVEKEKLTNVILLGSFDQAVMPDLFRHGDLLLVTLREHPLFDAVIPSKLQAYMQAGRPIVGAVNGECADEIQRAKAGLTVSAGDGKGLAEAIVEIADSPADRREAFGVSARQYFQDHFEADAAVDRLEQILLEKAEVEDA